MFSQQRLFKMNYPKESEVKSFLKENARNENINLSLEMKQSIRAYLVKYLNTLIDLPYSSEEIPLSWSDTQLVTNARHIRDYQGFLLLSNQKGDYSDGYIHFLNKYKVSIQNSIKEGNLFIAYAQVIKLFREITNLNKMGNQELIPNRVDLLKSFCEELEQTVAHLVKVQNEESKFWSHGLIALSLHALASVYYNCNNLELYDFEKSKLLLREVLKLCEEGEEEMSRVDEDLVNFFTLKHSLLPTLPYQSFAQEREEILALDIWLPEELERPGLLL